jgi:hypothetical protein
MNVLSMFMLFLFFVGAVVTAIGAIEYTIDRADPIDSGAISKRTWILLISGGLIITIVVLYVLFQFI